MSQRFSCFILLFAATNLFCFCAALYLPALVQAADDPLIRVGRTGSGPKAITIKARHVSLSDLLDKIENQSGIDFKIRGSLKNNSIDVNVEAGNWAEAVQMVLVDYSLVKLWGQDKTLTGVYVLEPLNPEVVNGLNSNSPTRDNNQNGHRVFPNRQFKNNKYALSKGQLLKLVRGRYRSPLAMKLWEDDQLRGFLQQNGINNYQDLMDSKKAMTIRQAARRELRNLRGKSSKQK